MIYYGYACFGKIYHSLNKYNAIFVFDVILLIDDSNI